MLLLTTLISTSAVPNRTLEETRRAKDYDVKAVLIYKFLLFVEWRRPIEFPEDRFVIGLVGENPFRGSLDTVFKQQKVQKRQVEIRVVQDKEEFDNCHVLFIPFTERHRLKRTVALAKERGILLLGDTPGFGEKGIHINFFENEDQKLRFEINVEQAREAGLYISSKLLKLARIVEKGGQSP